MKHRPLTNERNILSNLIEYANCLKYTVHITGMYEVFKFESSTTL
jgi:hypothetical protein